MEEEKKQEFQKADTEIIREEQSFYKRKVRPLFQQAGEIWEDILDKLPSWKKVEKALETVINMTLVMIAAILEGIFAPINGAEHPAVIVTYTGFVGFVVAMLLIKFVSYFLIV